MLAFQTPSVWTRRESALPVPGGCEGVVCSGGFGRMGRAVTEVEVGQVAGGVVPAVLGVAGGAVGR